jgi:hypothetical protein
MHTKLQAFQEVHRAKYYNTAVLKNSTTLKCGWTGNVITLLYCIENDTEIILIWHQSILYQLWHYFYKIASWFLIFIKMYLCVLVSSSTMHIWKCYISSMSFNKVNITLYQSQTRTKQKRKATCQNLLWT